MKKKLTAILLSLTMIVGISSAAMAKTLKEDFVEKVNAFNSLGVTEVFKVTEGDVVEPVNEIKVPTDIKVKEGNGSYAQSASSDTGSGTFGFETTMNMQTVKTTYDNYIALAKQFLTITDEQIDALDVSGQFEVIIEFPEQVGFDSTATRRDEVKGEKSMAGFASNNGIFVENTDRVWQTEKTKLKITIDLKEGTKASELKAPNAFDNLVLEYTGFEVSKKGSYVIKGQVTGYIDIKQGQDHLVHIPFASEQAKDVGDTVTNEIQATFTVTSGGSTPPGGGGGGMEPQKSTAKVTLNDGEKNYSEKEVTLTNGKYVWDFSTVENLKSEGNKIFIGWFKDAANQKPASNKETITQNTTFYAGWLDTKYDIDFKLNGTNAPVNTGMTGSVVISGDEIIVNGESVEVRLSDITIKGAKILGWYLDAEHTIPAEPTTIITEDTVFYAVTEDIDVPPALDTDGDHYAYVIGYPDGTVKPENSITREEVATIFFRLLTEEARNANFKTSNTFTDVNADRWSNNAISTMAEMGIITGYAGGTFKPSNNITRAEFATIAARFDDGGAVSSTFSDMAGHWAEAYVAEAASLQWINGYSDGTFKPDNYITRAEVMTIVNRMLKRSVSSENIHADAIRWTDNPEEAWYYEAVIEATNSHKFDRLAEDITEEKWTELLENRDWSELEK